MTRKFKNKYRVDTVRAKWWDYTNNGSYFVTICTKDRQHFFGNIVETPKLGVTAKMELNEIGELAQKFWMEIPQHFPFVVLDEFVVMPNHVHGIICISKTVNAPKLGAWARLLRMPKKIGPLDHWGLSSTNTNGFVPSTPAKSTPNSPGKPVFMMSSLKTKNH